MKTPVVLVHSGTEFPLYLNDCITLLQHNSINVHLLLSAALHGHVKDNTITLEKLEDFEDENYKNYEILNFPLDYKDRFFERTSSRFFILANYAKQKGLTSFFHLENDIALFSDLTAERLVVENSGKEMWLVIDSEERCVPSIIWFKDHVILESLAEFIFNSNTFTDMENLYKFFNVKKWALGNFPLLPPDNPHTTFQIDYANYFSEFNSIFDGAALGQYLFGTDERENLGETTVFSPLDYEYKWEKKVPYLITALNEKIKINNLHMQPSRFHK